MRLLVTIQKMAMIFLLFWVGEAWAGFEEGEEAYLQENFPAALSEWRPLAEEGNAEPRKCWAICTGTAR
ncbi:MAG: hypothetical protein ABIU05_02905, partial [Nitrospirales bacterium]